jgi:hypothetical protein
MRCAQHCRNGGDLVVWPFGKPDPLDIVHEFL